MPQRSQRPLTIRSTTLSVPHCTGTSVNFRFISLLSSPFLSESLNIPHSVSSRVDTQPSSSPTLKASCLAQPTHGIPSAYVCVASTGHIPKFRPSFFNNISPTSHTYWCVSYLNTVSFGLRKTFSTKFTRENQPSCLGVMNFFGVFQPIPQNFGQKKKIILMS